MREWIVIAPPRAVTVNHPCGPLAHIQVGDLAHLPNAPHTQVGVVTTAQPNDLAVGLVLGGATLAGAAGGVYWGFHGAGTVGALLGLVGGAWVGGMAGIFLALLLWGL